MNFESSPDIKATEIVARFQDDPAFRNFVMSANGSSMFPTIVRGDRLHMQKREKTELELDDIILGRGKSGRFYVHRVVQVDPRVCTKGDNREEPDEVIEEVFATVAKVQKTMRSRARRLWLRAIYWAFERASA